MSKRLIDVQDNLSHMESAIRLGREEYAKAPTLAEKADIMDDLQDKQRLYRRYRSKYDVLYFTYEYFSDERNAENENNLIPPCAKIVVVGNSL